MRQQIRSSKEPAEKVVQDIRRATRKHYSAEENIRIVLEGLRGELTPAPNGYAHRDILRVNSNSNFEFLLSAIPT